MLFGILFLWQFPHFMAIAWMYREDYARAGIKMLPVVDPSRRRDVRADYRNVRDAGSHESASRGDRHGGNSLFLRRAGAGNDSAAGVALGESSPHQRAREVVDARHRGAYSDSFGVDDISTRLSMTAAATGRELGMASKGNAIEISRDLRSLHIAGALGHHLGHLERPARQAALTESCCWAAFAR